MDRYTGKPFLRLLDCYILKAIGHLNPKHEEGLRQMEPMLAKTFHSRQSWDRIVADQMHFDETFPDAVRRMWAGYEEWAKNNGVQADPETFTISFLERNFPEIVNSPGAEAS